MIRLRTPAAVGPFTAAALLFSPVSTLLLSAAPAVAAPPMCDRILDEGLRRACFERVERCEPLKTAAERDDCYRGPRTARGTPLTSSAHSVTEPPPPAEAPPRPAGAPVTLAPTVPAPPPAAPPLAAATRPVPPAAIRTPPAAVAHTAAPPVPATAAPPPVRVAPPPLAIAPAKPAAAPAPLAPVSPGSAAPPASAPLAISPPPVRVTPPPAPLPPPPVAQPALAVARPLPPPPSSLPPPSPPPITMPMTAATPETVVRAFYEALGRADAAHANESLIPEKRNTGAYEIVSMGHYYGSMRQPLRLVSVAMTDPATVRVRYTYTHASGRFCDGAAEVVTTRRDGAPLIERIRALNGC